MDWNFVNPFSSKFAGLDKVRNTLGLGGVNGWYDSIAGSNPISGSVSGFTDAIGLTDTKAPERGLAALETRADAAGQRLDTDMQPVFNMYEDAASGRAMGDVLDQYQSQMMGTENAASAGNVRNFFNPMYDQVLADAANQALAGAGSSLQSSAANNAVGTAVSNKAANMWNNAFQNAMADAGNKQGIYQQTAQMNLMPSMNWAQLQSDVAGTRYTRGMDLAQAAGQTAGLNNSIFGQLF